MELVEVVQSVGVTKPASTLIRVNNLALALTVTSVLCPFTDALAAANAPLVAPVLINPETSHGSLMLPALAVALAAAATHGMLT